MATRRRIASLISSATEILYLIGAGDRVVGVSHECDYPPEVAAKPRLTRSLVDAAAASSEIDAEVRRLASDQSALYTIDVELLARLKPDLIITQAQCDVCAVRYEDVAAAVRDTPALAGAEILALNPHSITDALADIRRVSEAIGDPETLTAACSVHANLTARVGALAVNGTEASAQKPLRTICLEWINPPMVAANWMPQMVHMAGGEPGLSKPNAHSTYADWRAIVEYDPEVLVIMPCGFDLERAIVEAQVLAGWPGWSELSAVRSARVFAVDGNAYFNRSGPRLVDSVEILGHLFHPDRLGPPHNDAARAWRRLETRDAALVPAS